MARAATLFAVSAAALLIAGLAFAVLRPQQHMGLTWPGTRATYGFGLQVPCYALSGVFALFAAFYAFGFLRISAAMARWHLWLSLSGVLLFAFGFALLASIAADGTQQHTSYGKLVATFIGMLLGPVLFAAGQLVFLLAAMRIVLPHRA